MIKKVVDAPHFKVEISGFLEIFKRST